MLFASVSIILRSFACNCERHDSHAARLQVILNERSKSLHESLDTAPSSKRPRLDTGPSSTDVCPSPVQALPRQPANPETPEGVGSSESNQPLVEPTAQQPRQAASQNISLGPSPVDVNAANPTMTANGQPQGSSPMLAHVLALPHSSPSVAHPC